MPAAISQIRNFNLKVIAVIHFTLMSIGLIGSWTPSSYLFYNSILVVFLIWSMYHQHEDPIQMAIAINGLSIVLDVLVLSFRWPTYNAASEKFSAAVAILHLMFRPMSLFVLFKLLEERTGSSGLVSEVFGGGRNAGSYEDIDRTNPPQTTPQSGGYDFATAQQI